MTTNDEKLKALTVSEILNRRVTPENTTKESALSLLAPATLQSQSKELIDIINNTTGDTLLQLDARFYGEPISEESVKYMFGFEQEESVIKDATAYLYNSITDDNINYHEPVYHGPQVQNRVNTITGAINNWFISNMGGGKRWEDCKQLTDYKLFANTNAKTRYFTPRELFLLKLAVYLHDAYFVTPKTLEEQNTTVGMYYKNLLNENPSYKYSDTELSSLTMEDVQQIMAIRFMQKHNCFDTRDILIVADIIATTNILVMPTSKMARAFKVADVGGFIDDPLIFISDSIRVDSELGKNSAKNIKDFVRFVDSFLNFLQQFLSLNQSQYQFYSSKLLYLQHIKGQLLSTNVDQVELPSQLALSQIGVTADQFKKQVVSVVTFLKQQRPDFFTD